MREHVVDYFEGDGLAKDRWSVETPEYSADASSYGGPIIGGRLIGPRSERPLGGSCRNF